MRRHISDEDFAELQAICRDWQKSRNDQADCLDGMIDLFDCDADDALDLLNAHSTATGLIDSLGVEIHNGGKCSEPWPEENTQ